MSMLKEPITGYQSVCKTLPIEGSEIYYYVAGEENEETIVFLHPAFSDHHAFDYQLEFFAKTYHVITIDLIGHGLSKAKESDEKVDASGQHIYQILSLTDIVHNLGNCQFTNFDNGI